MALVCAAAGPSRADAQIADPSSPFFFGDLGGARADLAAKGVDLFSGYTTESADNVSGGREQSSAYAHQIALGANLDFGKLEGIEGFQAHILVVNREGSNLSARAIGNLFQVQEVYGGGGRALRLVNLTVEQSLFDGRFDAIAGRMTEGQTFAFSRLYCNFQTVAVCGHPNILPFNGGFSVFPISSWGARLQVKPIEALAVQVGAFEVDPWLGGKSGFNFSTNHATGVSVPVELDYTLGDEANGLPGHYKIGGFYDTSTYADVYTDIDGGALGLSGLPGKRDQGRGSVYALADQMIYRTEPGYDGGLMVLAGYVDADRSSSMFEQFGFLGLLLKGPFSSRPSDTVGLMGIVGKVNGRLQAAEDQERSRGLAVAPQSTESVIEMNYGAQIVPWFRILPNLQIVMRPGATSLYQDAIVLGLKTDMQF